MSRSTSRRCGPRWGWGRRVHRGSILPPLPCLPSAARAQHVRRDVPDVHGRHRGAFARPLRCSAPVPLRDPPPNTPPPLCLQGTCDRFQPPAGYWCSTHVQVRGRGTLLPALPACSAMPLTRPPLLPLSILLLLAAAAMAGRRLGGLLCADGDASQLVSAAPPAVQERGHGGRPGGREGLSMGNGVGEGQGPRRPPSPSPPPQSWRSGHWCSWMVRRRAPPD